MRSPILIVALALTTACHVPRFGPRVRGPRPPVPGPAFVAPSPTVPGPAFVAPSPGVPGQRYGRRRGGVPSPYGFRYSTSYVPAPHRVYDPGWAYWRHWRPQSAEAESDEPVEVPPYQPPQELHWSLGDPTIGTDPDVIGEWRLDAHRSAQVMKAWLQHLARAYGSDQDIDVSDLEDDFAELDARLSIHAGGTYAFVLHPKENDRAPLEWEGRWTFAEGRLDLGVTEDVDGIPVESEDVYEFNYYRNAQFTGLVVVKHALGLVLVRG